MEVLQARGTDKRHATSSFPQRQLDVVKDECKQCEHTRMLMRDERVANPRAALEIGEMYQKAVKGEDLSQTYTGYHRADLFSRGGTSLTH